MKSVVSEKGQVTIPKSLRDKLGLHPGQILDFETRNGLLVGRKAEPVTGVDAVYGILPRMDVDREIEEMRGKAWNPKDDGRRANRRRQ